MDENPFILFKNTVNVLVVDDMLLITRAVQEFLELFKIYAVSTANSTKEAMDIIEKAEKRYHACLFDLGMNDVAGNEFHLLDTYRKIMPFIIMTSCEDREKALHNGYMAIIDMPADLGYHRDASGGYITGHQIADALKFRISGTDVATIDDAEPAGYSDNYNQPYSILSTAGFQTNDEVNRSFEDMGDESGGGGYSKSQFFLTKACDINNYIYTTPLYTSSQPEDDPNLYDGTAIIKNIGNLYALGHNGLICMGTASSDCMGEDKRPFTTAIKNGKDFGEAFVAQQNSSWHLSCVSGSVLNVYALLGAGSLHSQPYIQYGSSIEQNMTITTTQSFTSPNPIFINNVTVNGNGNWTVTSTYNSNNSPPGTHSEIVVRPETDFAPTGSNMVHLIAN